MNFARKQLEKYGWSEGKGLGKHEDGIVTALKPQLKFDNAGVGHDPGEQFTNNWWEKLFNKAADNIQIESGKNDVRVKLKSKGSVEITTKDYSVKDFKKNSHLEYGSFLKTAKLTGSSVEQYDVPSISEPKTSFQAMTDEELFAACGGRTAHKGARHGLKLSGKLTRIEKQEKMLLKKMKKVSISDTTTEKKMKKLKKYKDETKEKYVHITEDSMESTSSNGLKKKKKRKSVSFSETVTITPIYPVDLDTSIETIESEGDSLGKDENCNAITTLSPEDGLENIENSNDQIDNPNNFELNINDLSKAERKKLKKKRKMKDKKLTSTGIFLQKLQIDPNEDANTKKSKNKEVNLKKRKYIEESEQDLNKHSSKPESSIRQKSKKEKQKIKKQKKVEEKMDLIVESLDVVCRISESE
ncbi:unnamed protein product [Phyllotreta striolata]|uniref:G patch domain-containing protein 4 n=1 Tax=Phyllotreta striolata TaxID=444603 RepID=A0A9N9TEG6_PHYSR|nr:unnamed protein product [Phyllotreta striolata]